jgi:hypothetical protein
MMDVLKMPKVPKAVIPTFSEKEVERLLAHAELFKLLLHLRKH